MTPWIAARQASLSITISRSSLKLMSIKSVMPSSHLILWRPLLLLPPIPPSIRVFSNESTLCMRWPKYWSFSFSIIPSKEHPGLISFRMDWLDLFAVQGTLKSLLQHHSSKALKKKGYGLSCHRSSLEKTRGDEKGTSKSYFPIFLLLSVQSPHVASTCISFWFYSVQWVRRVSVRPLRSRAASDPVAPCSAQHPL